jgi:hypothetical protein
VKVAVLAQVAVVTSAAATAMTVVVDQAVAAVGIRIGFSVVGM